MRWRLVDRIVAFEPWARIAGRKASTFEEISLLDRFGRPGEFPASLVLECAVQLAGWLVLASSGHRRAARLDDLQAVRFPGRVGAGGTIETEARVEARDADRLVLSWSSRCGGQPVCDGRMALSLAPTEDGSAPDRLAALWRELYAPD
jgi:3-hydroxymyristoyl/3-hydroxydecanoyl-(acyl carrier protein) dehydratase